MLPEGRDNAIVEEKRMRDEAKLDIGSSDAAGPRVTRRRGGDIVADVPSSSRAPPPPLGPMEGVIDETLRLVNVAPMLFRTVLQDVDFSGYRFPKGWKVMPWLRAPHMDAEYFPQPEKFIPERWDDKNVNFEAFRPFGGGARTCVGNKFARLQVSVFLHHVSVGYKWTLLNPDAKMQHLPHPKPVDGGPMNFAVLA
ncbi:hypothetical protein R1sor_003761 [Riccia sorocarpa]|uniref:Cytochrome P450 n=1 Tax=Riccia sorocarpa TaxID=122646 RepID=A0ABD3H5E1_9MARC